MDFPTDFMMGSINNSSSTEKKNNELATEDFLQIMAASIKMPSMPGEEGSSGGGGETDYLAQLAQFNTLDQLTTVSEMLNMNVVMTQQQQALGLLGKEVKVVGAESGFISGTVDKVKFDQGYATIQIGGKDYALNAILEVGDQA
ncbi:flagellar hook assembly protein [Carnobacterium sp. ISL-102]|uniref:flagellar hook assembly protein n=1 Tax=Carnobacterium sp. ISL-102 TaxID=2819142 RepID=UPI001BE600AA|nr:flagellar hook assembly protein [Carnobacterium sp. ISL-102]MBT2731867.1 flagellar hook assembly protein [Carnobacterium sp. ISL-102]